MKIEIVKYPRSCETCGKGMTEGYLVGGGTYDTLECAGFTEAEWEAHYSDDGEDCWTEWTLEDCEDEEDLQFQAILAKNQAAVELRSAEPNINFVIEQLKIIEEFTGTMNQPAIADL